MIQCDTLSPEFLNFHILLLDLTMYVHMKLSFAVSNISKKFRKFQKKKILTFSKKWSSINLHENRKPRNPEVIQILEQ